ncbi:unnamed protein product (mitochondrion) [Plasmodiophora brassicae]|uniref:Deacetylase sirtuin-type domain-containing protein n=2 Tax=Plasmodiophora brassicae TaxID=37360 RepID=A0A3P3YCD5_PLABS|nr:unnamed protein product [Plasmodiophora brassicae]
MAGQATAIVVGRHGADDDAQPAARRQRSPGQGAGDDAGRKRPRAGLPDAAQSVAGGDIAGTILNHLSEDEEDIDFSEADDQCSSGSVMSNAFDTATELLEWVQARQLSACDPGATLRSLLQHCTTRYIPDPVMWDVVRKLASMIAKTMIQARVKLNDVNTLDDACDLIRKSSNIIVLSGAGVSVSCGIPDFRSKNGIYARIKDEFGLPQPESMFDIRLFRENPDIFYSFAHELFPGSGRFQPSLTHHFISLLERRGKLLRNYSQNIDDLEHYACISKVYQCHGSFATASCVTCMHQVPGDQIGEAIIARRKPLCPMCHGESADESRLDPAFGVMKPDIVFFGEPLGQEFDNLLSTDLPKVDLVIVVGSSLVVHPVASVIGLLEPHIPIVLINREVVGHPHAFDIELLGDADRICSTLTSMLGDDWALPNASEPAAFQFHPPNRYVFPGAKLPDFKRMRGLTEDAVTEDAPARDDSAEVQ